MNSSEQRFVLDANVIVSAALSAHSKSRQAFDFAIATVHFQYLIIFTIKINNRTK